MGCGEITARDPFQARLEALNPESAAAIKRAVAAQMSAGQGALHPSSAEEALQAQKVRLAERVCLSQLRRLAPTALRISRHFRRPSNKSCCAISGLIHFCSAAAFGQARQQPAGACSHPDL